MKFLKQYFKNRKIKKKSAAIRNLVEWYLWAVKIKNSGRLNRIITEDYLVERTFISSNGFRTVMEITLNNGYTIFETDIHEIYCLRKVLKSLFEYRFNLINPVLSK